MLLNPCHLESCDGWIARPQARPVSLRRAREFRLRLRPQRRPHSVRPGEIEEANLRAFSKFIPGTMFQGVQPIQ